MDAGSLIRPAVNHPLEATLKSRLNRGKEICGSLGELEALAVRIGLIQDTAKPRLPSARLVVFAADHGLAVEGLGAQGRPSTAQIVASLVAGQLSLSALAEAQGLEFTVVDSGLAEDVPPHARLLVRKIGHGTRNCRVGPAMPVEQAHAAMRAGMEIGDSLDASAAACAGLGIGSSQSAALLLSCLSEIPLEELIEFRDDAPKELRARQQRVLELARERHGHLEDPVELLAAVGGFEIAMMAGFMLEAASRRRVIVSDGLASSAALMVASAIAPATLGYCIHARSSPSAAVGKALAVLGPQVSVDFGLNSIDGFGATLVWPLLRSAVALLTDVAHQVRDASALTRQAST